MIGKCVLAYSLIVSYGAPQAIQHELTLCVREGKPGQLLSRLDGLHRNIIDRGNRRGTYLGHEEVGENSRRDAGQGCCLEESATGQHGMIGKEMDIRSVSVAPGLPRSLP